MTTTKTGTDAEPVNAEPTHPMKMRSASARGHLGASLFARADRNQNGRVSLAEFEAASLRDFDQIELNHDGRITPDEYRHARQLRRAAAPAE